MTELFLFLSMACNPGCVIDTNAAGDELDIITPAVQNEAKYMVENNSRLVIVNLYPESKQWAK